VALSGVSKAAKAKAINGERKRKWHRNMKMKVAAGYNNRNSVISESGSKRRLSWRGGISYRKAWLNYEKIV
jgi:hypothetical protein